MEIPPYIVESLNARVRWFWLTFINLSMPSLTFWRKTKHFETCSKTTKKLTIFLNIRMTVYEHNSAYLQTDCLSANCIVHCFWQNGCGCSHCCCFENNKDHHQQTANMHLHKNVAIIVVVVNSNYHQQAANIANSKYHQQTANTHLFRNVLSSDIVIVVV